jgi:PAS domain S-box-containing protein
MTIKFRFVLLLAAVLGIMLVTLGAVRLVDNRHNRDLRVSIAAERFELEQKWIESLTSTLRVFVDDYSPWDEMVEFIKNPTAEWQRVNLENPIGTHDLDAIWIFTPEFRQVGHVSNPEKPQLGAFPVSEEIMRELCQDWNTPHFFVRQGNDLIEIQIRRVRFSDKQIVPEHPLGWLAAAVHWDEERLNLLTTLSSSQVALLPANARPTKENSPDIIETLHPLPDWQGKPIAQLAISFEPKAPKLLAKARHQTLLILLVCSALLAAALYFAANTWVVRPLASFHQALADNRPDPLREISEPAREFRELKDAMESFFRQQRELRQIYEAFNAIDDAVLVSRVSDRRLVHVNEGACHLLGIRREELLGRRLDEFLLPANADAPAETGERIRHSDGRILDVEIREQTFPGPADEALHVAVARDVTQRKAQEKTRLRNQRMESLGTLAGGVAHDLNNMLTPVVMVLDEMENSRTIPEAELVSTVRANVQRCANMLRQLLNFGRGRDEDFAPLELHRVLEDILRISRSTFPKSIAIQAHIPRHMPKVMGDPTQLHQVFLNLCVNARDAMPQGGEIKITATHVSLTPEQLADWPELKPGNHISIEVGDTGQGIRPEHLDRIFEPFFTTKATGEGTGLGLSTTLGIIQQHEGAIRVTSQPGEGSLFTILLPCHDSEIPAESPPPPSASAPTHGDGSLILVIEDDELLRMVLSQTLQRLGYTVRLADSGQNGIDILEQAHPHIRALITDVNMPGMDGRAVLATTRQRWPHLPVVVMSGKMSEALQQELLQAGATAVLEKPFGSRTIVETLSVALSQPLDSPPSRPEHPPA